jgi:preprotein translocase subunit SecE
VGSAQRIVIFAYIIIGLVTAITIARLLGAITLALSAPDPQLFGNFNVTDVLGIAIAVGAGVYAYKNPRVHDYCLDVVSELRKVTWPSRKETQTATVIVIITTLLAAVVLGAFDQIWGMLTGLLYHRA